MVRILPFERQTLVVTYGNVISTSSRESTVVVAIETEIIYIASVPTSVYEGWPAST